MVSTEVATEGEGSKQRQSVTAFRSSTRRSHARRYQRRLLPTYLTSYLTLLEAVQLDMQYG